MSQHELDQFKGAEVEFSTTDRTYCSNADCRRFISSKDIEGDRALCPYCNSSTCHLCKSTYHDKNDCIADSALQATLALAKRKGWQRCYACRAVVQLEAGCYHMRYPLYTSWPH
ncbi:hypothetical protein BJX76DRAFT_325077 [Aspergillus varians]